MRVGHQLPKIGHYSIDDFFFLAKQTYLASTQLSGACKTWQSCVWSPSISVYQDLLEPIFLFWFVGPIKPEQEQDVEREHQLQKHLFGFSEATNAALRSFRSIAKIS